MATLATKFNALPDGVRGVIYEFLPRHDTATLIAEGINKRDLRLKYVRSRYIPSCPDTSIYWDHRISPTSTMFITQNEPKIAKHLKELRPTKLLCDTYGNGSIKRIDISIGEKARLRAIKHGLSRLHRVSYDI
tara:strand:+ start:5219 stop:5617 length:399 start_codon:yes stop_codon:yes gene_type:complete